MIAECRECVTYGHCGVQLTPTNCYRITLNSLQGWHHTGMVHDITPHHETSPIIDDDHEHLDT